MPTRKHLHEEKFDGVWPERMFALLVTPSAIRDWWGAAHAIVVPRPGGTWAAAWGADEDDPDFVSTFRILELDRPRRLVLANGVYHAKAGAPSFNLADLTTTFRIEPTSDGGCVLTVVQDGFPTSPDADEFFAACGTGWTNTFAGIRRHLSAMQPATGSDGMITP
jgi:uncharacterized protein YndB with AHSA1/START domain